MTGPEPAADRGPDEPHPSRLAPDHPRRDEVLAASRVESIEEALPAEIAEAAAAEAAPAE